MKPLSTTLLFLATCVFIGFGCSSKPEPSPSPAADCSVDASCTLGAACSNDSDCIGSHCDRGTGTCVACLVDTDCDSGQDCVASACLSRCQTDAQCAAGQHCSQSKHCQACGKDADCAADEHCSAAACVKDRCKKAAKECDPDSNGVRICSANGDSSRVVPCNASNTCAAGKDGASCQAWICTPDSKSCDDEGKAVRTCASDGLSFEGSSACKRGTTCLAGECVGSGCTPNRTFCSGNDSRSCASDGQTSTLLRSCGDTALCEESTGLCRSKSCAPGSTVCDGQNVATCKADGSGYDSVACKLSQVCTSGACQDLLCAPYETFCDANNTLKTCNATGTGITSTSQCSGPCTANVGTSAYCASKTCQAGTPMCNGSIATLCRSDGMGPEQEGPNCADFDAYCSSGTCVPHICPPAQRFCVGNSIYQCSATGNSSYLYGNCGTGYVCYPGTAACMAQVCTANGLSCVGSTVIKCDALGLTVAAVQECSSTGQACLQGQCVSSVCSAYAAYCKDGNVWQCNSSGTGEELYQVCTAGTHCQGSSCITNACTPGSAVCSGNTLTTCAADGSGAVSGGTPCAANQVCANGACQTQLCTPNTFACVSGDVYQCDTQGLKQAPYQHCFSETYCSNGACVPDVCPNGAAYCKGETWATCLADGSGPASGTVSDCSASGKICTTSGCVTSVVEKIGSGLYPASGYAFGQILRVTTARKLTGVQFSNGGYAGGNVSTIVYSSTDGSNFYLLSSTAVADTGASTGYYDSGALSVQLQAGTYYLIGVASPDYWLSASRDQTGISQTLSFATTLKSFTSTNPIASSFAPTQATANFNFSVTTALP
ncbi:MAG TPA: hypothetical protein VFK05_34845 [Polyangiaceae bacterium]|nr:hypothetical protein [Polyangiaceae bacterium]